MSGLDAVNLQQAEGEVENGSPALAQK